MNKTILLLFLPAIALADCRKPSVVAGLRPGAQWVMTDGSITWLDKTQAQPTEAEISTAMNKCNSDLQAKDAAKLQAKTDAKNNKLSQDQRINALLILMDADK